jgi:hypothetical protein
MVNGAMPKSHFYLTLLIFEPNMYPIPHNASVFPHANVNFNLMSVSLTNF